MRIAGMTSVLVMSAIVIACGEPTATGPGALPPVVAVAAVDASAGIDAAIDASAIDASVASIDATVATSGLPRCVLADVTLRAIVSDCGVSVDAKDMAQPTDVDVKLVAPTSRVAPGASVVLELRYTNATSSPLRLRFDRQLHLDIATVDSQGTQIDPPSGSPRILPDPTCDTRFCPQMTPGIVVLAPGGTARVQVPWVAEKKAWPPPSRVPCCTIAPGPIVGAGPLAPGKYTVRVAGPLQGDATPAETVIDVAK